MGNQPIDPIESLRLDMDRLRLALDQARHQDERTRTFLERWRVDVQPVHEHRLLSREHAYGYAKVAIQTTFFLNGGALIAFPAFAQLVGTSLYTNRSLALGSILAFVIGLVLIAVTTLLAYLSMAADAEAVSRREEFVKAGLNQSQVPEAEKPGYDKIRRDAEDARKRHYDRAMRLSRWAVGLGIASIVAFLVGAFCAAGVFSGA